MVRLGLGTQTRGGNMGWEAQTNQLSLFIAISYRHISSQSERFIFRLQSFYVVMFVFEWGPEGQVYYS